MRKLIVILLLMSVLPASAQETPLRITVSFSILADVIQHVAGYSVNTLIPLGADPHGYMPTPRDIANLADSDVVFINGMGFEAGLLETIESAAPDLRPVMVSNCIPVLEAGAAHDEHEEDESHTEDTVHAEDANHNDSEHADESYNEALAALCDRHADELHHDEENHDHDETHKLLAYQVRCDTHSDEGDHDEHSACDPHVWTDPHNVLYWVLTARDTLSELDPANAERYATNAASYIEEIETLIHDMIEPSVATLPVENRVLVTNHETLGYFAAAYGFELVGTVIPGSSTAAEPSAAEIARLIDLVRAEGVPAIFAENTTNARLAEQVAAESSATFYTLYSDSLSESGGEAATYLDYMRYNVMTIVTALGGESVES